MKAQPAPELGGEGFGMSGIEADDPSISLILLNTSQHFQRSGERVVVRMSDEEDGFLWEMLVPLLPQPQNLLLGPSGDHEEEERGWFVDLVFRDDPSVEAGQLMNKVAADLLRRESGDGALEGEEVERRRAVHADKIQSVRRKAKNEKRRSFALSY